MKMFVSLTLTGGDFEETAEVVGISVQRWRAGEREGDKRIAAVTAVEEEEVTEAASPS